MKSWKRNVNSFRRNEDSKKARGSTKSQKRKVNRFKRNEAPKRLGAL
jgi:hypothetical protein